MSLSLFYVATVAVLLILLWWALRPARKSGSRVNDENALLGEPGRRHATYLPLIRQALSPRDIAFVAARGFPKLFKRMQRERRRVALAYLTALHEDFTSLLHLAAVAASLSPDLAPAEETERVWLQVQFNCRYQMVRVALRIGMVPARKLESLSHVVSELAVKMERAISEFGERATMAAKMGAGKMGSPLDG